MWTARWCWNDSDWEQACSIENTLSLPHYFSFRESDSDSEPSHSDISSHSLSQILAKIKSDRKRMKSPMMPAEQKEKHTEHLKKTKKMSSSSNWHGVDGGEVRASYILVKYQGSRRKASWNDAECQVIKKTTRNSAVFQIKAFHDDILSSKAKFEDIASRFSDCSSAKRAGDLSSYGSILRYKSIECLRPIGKHSLLAASGKISDFQEILSYLDELMHHL